MDTNDRRLSEIGDLAGFLRSFVEPFWKAWKAESGKPQGPFETDSAGMCGFTSCFVAMVLEREVGGGWALAGGRPLPANLSGGVTCTSGRQNGHFWAESEDGLIVDLTADQFGLPTVVVTTAYDPRYRATFSGEEIAEHLPKVEAVALQWLEAAEEEGVVSRPFGMAA